MFNVFKKVLNKNSNFSDEDVAKVSDFVFCRWLSGNSSTLKLAQMFNYYYNIPVSYKLKVAQKVINGRLKFIPYPKSDKMIDDKNLNSIAQYFNISINKAKMYAEFITEDELKYILKQIETTKQ